jgi:hypothetical protein
MSLTTLLINNSIPFHKDGRTITIEPIHMAKLIKLSIPFQFKDNKLLSSESKLKVDKLRPDNYFDNLITTIKKILNDSQKFTITSYSGHKLLLQYEGEQCMIDIIGNEFVMIYKNWINKIIINKSNPSLPNISDGFILLVIAGFKYRIASATWDYFWVLNSKLISYDCTYFITDKTYSNTQNFKFYNDGRPYIIQGLDDAIKHLDTFKM